MRSISLRLSKMPRPSKTSKSCGLHQLEPECPTISIFRNKTTRGWWPLTQKIDEELEIMGKVEVELELLTGIDAENSPAGLGREEPSGLAKP
ncbi:unnamed protein product, partial [Protopolystoma xenopodis]